MKSDYDKTVDAIHETRGKFHGTGLKVSTLNEGFTHEIVFDLPWLRVTALFQESGKAINPDFATLRAIFAAIGVSIEE